MREYSPLGAGHDALLKENLPCVVACQVKQWYFLVVAILPSRVFAIANGDCALFHIDIGPFDTTNLIFTHRGCDREAYDPCDRDQLARIALEIFVSSLISSSVGRLSRSLPLPI